MPVPDQRKTLNHLLRSVPAEEFALLAPHLEHVRLERGRVVGEPYEKLTHAYFYESAVVSVVAILRDGLEVEGQLVGCEGASPIAAVLGVPIMPDRAVVQVAGDAWRIDADRLIALVQERPRLRDILNRFVLAALAQARHTAMANMLFTVRERLARWLLMCDDRLRGNDVALTQEYVSSMLGVRRQSVTEALSTLEAAGGLEVRRGHILILSRAVLERVAGESYGQPEAYYAALLGSFTEGPDEGGAGAGALWAS